MSLWKTVIPAPVRCGTKLVCHEQCIRVPLCGHRPEPHECHDDSINCPKCTALVVRECDCGATLDIPEFYVFKKEFHVGKCVKLPKTVDILVSELVHLNVQKRIFTTAPVIVNRIAKKSEIAVLIYVN